MINVKKQKNFMKWKVFGTLIGFLSAVQLMASEFYRVKPGDTLSEIAQSHIGGQVYGKHGSLRSILKWNPSITNPDLLLPRQEIVIEPSFSSSKKSFKYPKS